MTEYKQGDRVQFLVAFSHDGVLVPAGCVGTVQRDGVSLLGFVSVLARRMLWLCKPSEIRPSQEPMPLLDVYEYRADGWPLCPRCGEDELWSLLQWNGEGERPPMSEYIVAGLSCYYCSWTKEKNNGQRSANFRQVVE
jgi:hypothetical protein